MAQISNLLSLCQCYYYKLVFNMRGCSFKCTVLILLNLIWYLRIFPVWKGSLAGGIGMQTYD